MTSEAISHERVGDVAVVEWHDLNPDDDAAARRVTRLLRRDSIEGYVAVDRTDDYIDPDASEAIERLAELAADNGIERVALVGEDIKALAAKGSFDRPGIEVYNADDRQDAVEWATDG